MKSIAAKGVRLEPLAVAHADEMFPVLSAATIYNYIPGEAPESLAALRKRYAMLATGTSPDGSQQWLNWIVRLESGQCAGFVQATIYPSGTGDFAFVLAPEFWGHGIAFEASQAAIAHITRDLGVAALFATVDPANLRSMRLLSRLGFAEIAPAEYPHGEVVANDRVFSLSGPA
jgi:[ribosomal protein S5]-alanine N-acetyltransferase